MIGGIVSGFLKLKGLMPLGIVAIMLLISGPSMILAWLKLRKRNLGPILDANGWAVNAKAKINVPFGGSLTRSPRCRRARSATSLIRSPRRSAPGSSTFSSWSCCCWRSAGTWASWMVFCPPGRKARVSWARTRRLTSRPTNAAPVTPSLGAITNAPAATGK